MHDRLVVVRRVLIGDEVVVVCVEVVLKSCEEFDPFSLAFHKNIKKTTNFLRFLHFSNPD